MTDTMQGLNPEQAAAVKATEGPMLILAGAGSGKTKVLTCRIAHLLDMGVSPFRILAITFTNKAAKEMRHRVDKMAGPRAKSVWLHTFHGFCARILQKRGGSAGHPTTRNFAIYDTTDGKTLIKNILKDLQLDEKRFQPAGMLSAISNAKNAAAGCCGLCQSRPPVFTKKRWPRCTRSTRKRLLRCNAMDFDDLLLVTIQDVGQNCPEVLAKYQDAFDYILVDEYQDTNHAQYVLTRCWPPSTTTCAWWATRTRAFTAGGVRISATSWTLKKIFPRPGS
jgi:DNA helicase-2/ATP-dependent DNA helicase PcrA